MVSLKSEKCPPGTYRFHMHNDESCDFVANVAIQHVKSSQLTASKLL